MIKSINSLITAIFASIFLLSCGEPIKTDETSVQTSPKHTKIDDIIYKKNNLASAKTNGFQQKNENTIKDIQLKKHDKTLFKKPLAVRYATPGSVRFKVIMQQKISFFRWSPLTGLVVSSGKEIVNITSKGKSRWRYVAGLNHQLFNVLGQEVVWSPKYNKFTQLLRHGRRGWTKKWSAKLVENKETQNLYLIDAATVASLNSNGKDRWRIALEGLRKTDGPYICANGNLFHGIRGLEGIAVSVSNRGSITNEIILERGSILLSANQQCEPLIWHNSEVKQLDYRGVTKWSIKYPKQPLVKTLKDSFLFFVAQVDKPAWIDIISASGKKTWSSVLPITGRVTNVEIINNDGKIPAIGLCLNVSSPCAKPNENRGPLNTILTSDKNHSYQILSKHIHGHLNITKHIKGGFITANSSTPNTTELIKRNANNDILWTVSLPGRLSYGPVIGPKEEIYLSTCKDWQCNAPYLLFSVTGTTPNEN